MQAEEAVASKTIDKTLKNHHVLEKDEVKLLLLGAGDAGKSTIFKQMKIIHQQGYSEEEKVKQRGVVWSNVIECVQSLISGADQLGISYTAISNLVSQLRELQPMDGVTPDIGRQMDKFWKNEATQQAYARTSEFQCPDSAAYFLNDIDRISSVGYVPSEQDILRTRVRTTGIVEAAWQYENITFKMFDVGGQRNERRKWIHCFDSVTAVIFVAALSEYDQNLYEDSQQNRMTEALALFEQISNSRWFLDTSIILFLNKKDLFEEKLKKKLLSDVFPEAKPANGEIEDFKHSCTYLENEFKQRCKTGDRKSVV